MDCRRHILSKKRVIALPLYKADPILQKECLYPVMTVSIIYTVVSIVCTYTVYIIYSCVV